MWRDDGKIDFRFLGSIDVTYVSETKAPSWKSTIKSYTLIDASGKKTAAQCLFPFTYLGEVRNSCIDISDHGQTKRPWCFLDTPTNQAKGAGPGGLTSANLVDTYFVG